MFFKLNPLYLQVFHILHTDTSTKMPFRWALPETEDLRHGCCCEEKVKNYNGFWRKTSADKTAKDMRESDELFGDTTRVSGRAGASPHQRYAHPETEVSSSKRGVVPDHTYCHSSLGCIGKNLIIRIDIKHIRICPSPHYKRRLNVGVSV